MKQWFNYAIATTASLFVFFLDQSQSGLIAGIVIFGLIIGTIASIDFLDGRYSIRLVLYSLSGFLVTLTVFGIAYSMFSKFPVYIFWGLWGFFSSLSTYFCYLYQKNKALGRLPQQRENKESVSEEKKEENTYKRKARILDTSVIIDGRIIDIVRSGFVEGPFIVPNFVLREIQLISDSGDAIKRSRGRRGLDMLNELQKGEGMEMEISYTDYSDIREVDAKLIRLTKEMDGILVTNDFNLNKVAKLQGLPIWNINRLTNALKPVVLPGEEMEIEIVKEGKDENQGIGYLDDGTMVVVGGGGGKVQNKKVRVSVTSVIQTNAGKMIFTKLEGKD